MCIVAQIRCPSINTMKPDGNNLQVFPPTHAPVYLTGRYTSKGKETWDKNSRHGFGAPGPKTPIDRLRMFYGNLLQSLDLVHFGYPSYLAVEALCNLVVIQLMLRHVIDGVELHSIPVHCDIEMLTFQFTITPISCAEYHI